MSKIWDFFSQSLRSHKVQLKHLPDSIESIGEKEDVFTNKLDNHFIDAKLFSLDDDVKELLIKTKGTNDIEKLPFDNIFINTEFNIENLKEKSFGSDCYAIKGLLVCNVNEMVLKNGDDWKSRKGIQGFRIYALILDIGGGYSFNTVNVIDKNDIFCENHKVETLTPKIRKFLLNFVSNFLNLINNPNDIIIQEQEYSVARNKKRVRQGLPKIPNKKVIIPIGNLKQHIISYNDSNFSGYSHKFWVRGHWKEFTDDRYKKAKGTKKWCFPFVKGKGVLIEKKYEVKYK